MRVLVLSLTLLSTLGVVGAARAQGFDPRLTESMDCPADAVQTSEDGTPVALPEDDTDGRSPHLPSGMCTDANDPACSSLPPAPDAPGAHFGPDLLRFLPAWQMPSLEDATLPTPLFVPEPTATAPNARDHANELERPPARG